jgi:hypothetical protein
MQAELQRRLRNSAAVRRVLAAFQQRHPDRVADIPPVLQPYLGGE